MKGLLIVNGFLNTAKFYEIYELLSGAAKRHNITLDIAKASDIINDLSNVKVDGVDFVIYWDKDIYLAERLEKMGIRLFNSAEAIKLCDNKILTAMRLIDSGIPHPRTVVSPLTFEGVLYNDLTFLENTATYMGLPMIIKEAYGSFGQQVYLANTIDEAKEIVGKLGNKQFLMQEYISSSCGRDIRVNVVGDKAVASMLRYNDNDFRSNISNGGSMKAVDITKEQEDIAIRAVKALGLDFAGVDVLFGKDNEPIICEVNSNPHFMSTLIATKVNVADHIMDYIVGELA